MGLSTWEVFVNGGREKTPAIECDGLGEAGGIDLGAGEIVLNVMNADGTQGRATTWR